jgi:hypothetical protein
MKHLYSLYFFSALLAAAACLSTCMSDEYAYPQRSATFAPAPDEARGYVNETFDAIAEVDGQHLYPPSGWSSFAVVGIRTFQTGVLPQEGGGVMRGAMATAYLSADTVNDFWLMTPPLDVSDSTATLTFQAGLTYSSASTKFMLMYSETYCGGADTINLSEWAEWPLPRIPETSSGPVKMTPQAPISFWGKGGDRKVVYVAFRYRSVAPPEDIAANDADRANYYFDNVVFRRK